MEIQDLKSSIDAIQLQLGELAKKSEKKAKGDFWINLISAIILPAAIAISGYWFSEALKKVSYSNRQNSKALNLKSHWQISV